MEEPGGQHEGEVAQGVSAGGDAWKGRLASLGAASVPADLTAFVASALLFLFSSQGLFVTGWLQWPPALAGVVCGLIGTGWWQAALAAALAVLAATLLQAPRLFGEGLSFPGTLWLTYVAIMLAWAAGAAVATSLLRGYIAARSLVWAKRYEVAASAAVVLALLWAMTSTAWTYQAIPQYEGKSGFDSLRTRPAIGTKMSDDAFYRNVVWLMRERGVPYYPAFRQAYHENAYWRTDPSFFLAYRLPTTYVMLSRVPGGGEVILALALIATTVTVLATGLLAAQRARWALATIAVAATAALGAEACSTQFVMYAELWALPLLVTAVLLHEMAGRSEKRWRALTVLAVAAAVGASLFREVSAFVFAAALVAAFFAPKERRGFAWKAWGGGLALVFVAIGAHYFAVRGALSGEGAGWLLRPSFVNIIYGLRFSTDRLAYAAWVLPLIAVLGMAAAALDPDRRSRAFLLCCLLLPLVAFSLLYNGGVEFHGERINYWGILVSPILYGLAPWTLARLPDGAREDREVTGAEGESEQP